MTLLLCSEGVLAQPLLYLSLFLKENRDEYYMRLQRVRTHGEWEEWLVFFLEGVVAVARSATHTTREILALVERDRMKIRDLGKSSGSTARLHEVAVQRIFFTIADASARTGLSIVTIGRLAQLLESKGIVKETTGRARGRLFVYDEYLSTLQADERPGNS